MGEKTVPWWHLFHRFNPWSEPIGVKSGGLVQTRGCTVCGKIQVRWL